MIVATAVFIAAAYAQGAKLIFFGDFTFLIPEPISEHMLGVAARESWVYFSQHDRRIDIDADGVDDFVAIALGASGGYGAQIRYRLIHSGGGREPRLGPWYWGVVTDARGERIHEVFNP